MNLLERLISSTLSDGSGQSGPSGAVLYTQQTLSSAQQAQARENIQSAAVPRTVQISGTAAVITPEDNTVYQCGELTSLTIVDPPLNGAWAVVFTSGAAATATVIPARIRGLEEFAPTENTVCEINVLDNRAAIGIWEIPASEGAE